MHTILVPVDGSVHAMKALQIACDLAEKYGGRIALLHILAKGRTAHQVLDLAVANAFDAKIRALLERLSHAGSAPVPDSVMTVVGETILDQAAAKVDRRGLDAEIMPIASGDPADCILTARKRTGAGTIVMGCRGTGGTDANAFGSVSQTVFAQADCTCLSVK